MGIYNSYSLIYVSTKDKTNVLVKYPFLDSYSGFQLKLSWVLNEQIKLKDIDEIVSKPNTEEFCWFVELNDGSTYGDPDINGGLESSTRFEKVEFDVFNVEEIKNKVAKKENIRGLIDRHRIIHIRPLNIDTRYVGDDDMKKRIQTYVIEREKELVVLKELLEVIL